MSPVGALNNGIELLADEQDPEMRDKCLELLADSEVELVIRAEGTRILLDPSLRETLAKGSSNGAVEARAAGAWLAHSLAAEAGGSIRLSDPQSEVLMIGATLPRG